MRVIGRFIDRLGAAAAALAALAVLAMVALMATGVFFRYVVGHALGWTDEAVGYVLVLTVMLGVADVMRRGENIRVDVIADRLPPRLRRAVEIGGLVAALVFAVALTWLGAEMVAFSAEVGLTTAGEIDIPSAWVQVVLPLGGVLLTLATLNRLLRVCTGATVEDPADGSDSEVKTE
ncbi:MAG: TRAP transporter small permease [Rhodospirillales bacterium]|nr:TRAP transporter small permease [Rhodospirillales bacterium]